MKPIEVRIRHEFSPRSRRFVDVPWGTDLEEVFRLLRAWGITSENEDIETENIYGQFVVSEVEDPYFEVILASD